MIVGYLKRWQDGETIRAIAVDANMLHGTLRKAFVRCFPAEYAEQVKNSKLRQRRARIKQLKADGLKAKEIAELCDVSVGVVYHDWT